MLKILFCFTFKRFGIILLSFTGFIITTEEFNESDFNYITVASVYVCVEKFLIIFSIETH